ncbi:putative DHHC-type zinc finger family protein [Monocercomonoides exilis]|uniref:putative DHHC-type zinc finger family protein n=1 Tax=Monocercomonoides exilis TaxID=2049356 RepID=UPI00355A725C|nr:putative DHHC-type zinc finger family protein [Monocercomonoides exilis]|eukprot:MONOS_13757.1-p1 / transcript=MONOS_13757.1 / gene=MONOS_13757 / organism=Monocercomonoides_exilis_PA203 / gene_product=DHHC-type zinc finger family protein isoform 2 / transcript_product=DHHC-type zinc finger family protein isoform 2 / location=Mono_scaffold00877:20685-22974(-) / protein_length=592 / sequence_SO=supercontig / SO=protein_coding / is_pseudo=false
MEISFGVFAVLVGSIGVLGLFVVYLCGGTLGCRSGVWGRAFKWLTCGSFEKRAESAPAPPSKDEGRRTCGKMVHYLVAERNPIVQIFYVLVAGGMIGGWAVFVCPHVPNFFWDSVQNAFCGLFAVLAVVLFFVTCYSDPGFVTAGNVEDLFRCFPYDNVIYSEEKMCPVCKLPRPPRSQHCSMCGRCVSKRDHHCPWFNTCIGEWNFRYFLLFLFVNGVAAMCMGISSMGVIGAWLVDRRLWVPARLRVLGVRSSGMGWSKLLQIVVGEKTGCVALGLYGIILGLFVFGFLAVQIVSMVTNRTTAEEGKMDRLKSLRRVAEYLLSLNGGRTAAAKEEEEDGEEEEKGKRGGEGEEERWAGWVSEGRRKELESDVGVALVNKYSKGVWENAMEVCLPLSLRERPPVFGKGSALNTWEEGEAGREGEKEERKEERKEEKSSMQRTEEMHSQSSTTARAASAEEEQPTTGRSRAKKAVQSRVWTGSARDRPPLPRGFLGRGLFRRAEEALKRKKEEEAKRREEEAKAKELRRGRMGWGWGWGRDKEGSGRGAKEQEKGKEKEVMEGKRKRREKGTAVEERLKRLAKSRGIGRKVR